MKTGFQMPPHATILQNLAAAALRNAQRLGNSKLLVSHEVRDARLALCNVCPKKEGSRCSLCHCFVGELSLKLRLAAEQCPDVPPRWLAEPLQAP